MASAGSISMTAAGVSVRLHPACRVRQEGFGLLFYDARGPRLLFAPTGNMLPRDYFDTVRLIDELPEGLSESQKSSLRKFTKQLVDKGYLREQ